MTENDGLPLICPLWPNDLKEACEILQSSGCTLQHSQVRQSLEQPLYMTMGNMNWKGIRIIAINRFSQRK